LKLGKCPVRIAGWFMAMRTDWRDKQINIMIAGTSYKNK
jgi:hypothetical protein